MHEPAARPGCRAVRDPARARSVVVAGFGALLFLLCGAVDCSTTTDGCAPGDEDGLSGGSYVEIVSVSDTAFTVGGVDSGSTEQNIAVENLSTVTLTLTNVGTRPHDLFIQCIPTGLPLGCPSTSCFPAEANFGPLLPGQQMTKTFMTPAVEGNYPFLSTEPGDSDGGAEGGVAGPHGVFVLL
jgi:hypothetical protein